MKEGSGVDPTFNPSLEHTANRLLLLGRECDSDRLGS